jgi:3-dehydroquinate dehydratase-1
MLQTISPIKTTLSRTPQTVGVISSPGVLADFASKSAAAQTRACDLVELRLDLLKLSHEQVREAALRLAVPILITARHPAEGGEGPPEADARAAMLEPLLDIATLMDVELRSLQFIRPLISAAKEQRVEIVGSFHDFEGTPSSVRLFDARDEALRAGLGSVKIACTLTGPSDLIALMEQSTKLHPLPFSMMGMGELGRLSRLALAKLGSWLNYGYLGESNAPGQWPAPRLKELLSEI